MSNKENWGDWNDYTSDTIKNVKAWLANQDIVSLTYRPIICGHKVDGSHRAMRFDNYDYTIEIQCRKSNGSLKRHILSGIYQQTTKKNNLVREGPKIIPNLKLLLPHPKAVSSQITRDLGRIVKESPEIFKVCDWEDETYYHAIHSGEDWYKLRSMIKWQKKQYLVQIYPEYRMEDCIGCIDPNYRFHIYYSLKLTQPPALSPLGKIVIQRARLFPETIAFIIFSYLEDKKLS
jgi:hypothetical protein